MHIITSRRGICKTIQILNLCVIFCTQKHGLLQQPLLVAMEITSAGSQYFSFYQGVSVLQS